MKLVTNLVLGLNRAALALGGDYPRVGALCALIYALGAIAIWWAPDTTGDSLDR